jgi:hypothetical protein
MRNFAVVLKATTAFTLFSSSVSFTHSPIQSRKLYNAIGTHDCRNKPSRPTSLSPFHHETHHPILLLHQAKSSSTETTKSKKKVQGVYARPSAAIERGSGFFVPGLEGSRVRILFGITVLILNYVNHTFVPDDMAQIGALVLSEKLASFYGVLLLAQGLIESAKEMGLGLGGGGGGEGVVVQGGGGVGVSGKDGVSSKGLDQMISTSLRSGESSIDAAAMSWVAATYVALTPATHILLLEVTNGVGEILYSLGDFSSLENGSDKETQEGIISAMDTVYPSTGGRVSIPSSHPASRFLLPEENTRCVLLQRIDRESDEDRQLCLFAASDQLLAAFTKNDLNWLGSLGKYMNVNNL